MDFAEYKDVLVVLELDEGKPVNVSLENIAAAKSVANGGKVIAVTVCENAGRRSEAVMKPIVSIGNQDPVTLITRPRRFGKTLNMSMIENFFCFMCRK